MSNNQVAMLIDNRSNSQSDLIEALAITALGSASELDGDRSDKLVHYHLNRHPYVAEFLQKPDTAVISVLVTDYILARFDRSERIRVDNTF
jgi:hypothetical protein